MMIEPGINKLMKNVDSRYTLVMMVAKRARELAEENSTPLVNIKTDKTVTIAANEIAEGLVVVSHEKS